MKILLVSHAAWRRTGYGAPVADLVHLWRGMGHDAAVLAIEERGPAVVDWLPPNCDPCEDNNGYIRHYTPLPTYWHGADILPMLVEREKADVVVSLCDIWPMGQAGLGHGGVPWIAWFPVDQDPPQRGLRESAQSAKTCGVFSAWGAEVLRRMAPELAARTIHLPYGIDFPSEQALSVVQPLGGFPKGAWVIGMVGTNGGNDRKNIPAAMLAFARFARDHDDAHLLVWCNPAGDLPGARNLAAMRGYLESAYPYLKDRIRFPNLMEYLYGGDYNMLARVYSTLSVLLQPSAAEGFGLPVIEAQSFGVPVLATNCSSMTELVPDGTGLLIEGVPEWSAHDGIWRRPSAARIREALEQWYELTHSSAVRGDEIKVACRANAAKYDIRGQESLWEGVLG